MYFPIGWPKYLHLHNGLSNPLYVFCNRERSLFAILTDYSLEIWFSKPTVQIICHHRSSKSLSTLGTNKFGEWRPDSATIVVVTSQSHLLFYNLDIDESLKGLYEQKDSKVANLRRESAELFIKERIPPLVFAHSYSCYLPGNITSLVCIRDELMVATENAHIWRVGWDGTINRDLSLDLQRIPFYLDQEQSRGQIDITGLHVVSIEYSPLIGGFSVVFSNGRAAFITATTLQFDPSQVFGIWAPEVTTATCTAVNHRYRLIAYGLKNAEGVVFSLDDNTGCLQLSHRLLLSSKEFPDVCTAAGAVNNLCWTPEGVALAMTWEKGGLALWSVFGALLTCTLSWDYGSAEAMKNNPYRICSLEWGAEGYHLWTVTKSTAETPTNRIALMQFIKSVLTVNTSMLVREHVFLQGEDRLFISAGSRLGYDDKSKLYTTSSYSPCRSSGDTSTSADLDSTLAPNSVGNKQWIIVPIDNTYLASNWPIRYAALDSSGHRIAIAGKSGLAHYSLAQKRWKLFGNETQEQDFLVMGGLLWWEDQIILGCYNFKDHRDELRIYPSDKRLDNNFVSTFKIPTQILQLTVLGDRLLTFSSDSLLTLYQIQRKTSPTASNIHLLQLHELDISSFVVHPAFVISATLTSLRTESVRLNREGEESILLNVYGRLIFLQQDPSHRTADVVNNNQSIYSATTVLASCVESIWVSPYRNPSIPHLSEALWIACGIHGLRVWLPLYPKEGEKPHAHNFMSKRIMLPIQNHIYPLALLFEEAVILGAETDTLSCNIDNSSTNHSLCVVSRNSQVYLHYILRQLLRRNLGYHAWEIAQSCANLPYFPHSLELLLHEVLEEEATSSEPIPDALLPRVIDFIREFPVFLQTVVQCARKTELALWPHLFSAVGNPKDLFQQCLEQGHLETAASYLIILQNLEVCSVSRQHATHLLHAALDASKWELAKDLVRFLRAIDPSDVESPPRASLAFSPPAKLSHPAPPVSPTEDDLSFALGTVALTRGRSHSGNFKVGNEQAPKKEMPTSAKHISEPRIIPNSKRTNSVLRPGEQEEEFYLDAILHHHARRLLTHGHLRDLGYLAAHLDFHLISFLRKERGRGARVFDFVTSLKALHQDFNWPYPIVPLSSILSARRNSAGSSSTISEDVYKSLEGMLSSQEGKAGEARGDSGYISNPSTELPPTPQQHQIIEAHLLPRTVPRQVEAESQLTLSEDGSSLWGEDSSLQAMPLEEELWTGADSAQELISRGPQQSEVQLRYLFQVLLEACCVEWALLVAIILRDSLAVIRVANAARLPDLPPEHGQRLRDGLASLEQWAEIHCLGYKPFISAIRAQVRSKLSTSVPRPHILKFHSSPPGPSRENSFCSEGDNSLPTSPAETSASQAPATKELFKPSLAKKSPSGAGEMGKPASEVAEVTSRSSECSIS